MTRQWPHRLKRVEGERGSVTLFFVIACVGLLVMAGLVVDGGTKAKALQRADRVAAEAARTGGQAITVPTSVTGDPPLVQTGVAAAAAEGYLRAAGVRGDVAVLDGGRRLTVTTTITEDTIFLGLIGIHTVRATGRAEATLVRGITEADQ
jgi:Flp pilus assembly protein TadG